MYESRTPHRWVQYPDSDRHVGLHPNFEAEDLGS